MCNPEGNCETDQTNKGARYKLESLFALFEIILCVSRRCFKGIGFKVVKGKLYSNTMSQVAQYWHRHLL